MKSTFDILTRVHRAKRNESHHMNPRIIAVDWSGSKTRAERKIWLAEVDHVDGSVLRLEAKRDREMLTQHLIQESAKDANMIVGLDFAFSLPAWYLQECGMLTVRALWERAAKDGPDWLDACEPPFWGRPGKRRPAMPQEFRQTELDARSYPGVQAKSVFQIGGAGAVGTGSIRGMPTLAMLADAGFSIWSFSVNTKPLVVEIYPRLLTGAVIKSNEVKRREYLDKRSYDLPPDIRTSAIKCEDAFDALVSALVMAEHVQELEILTTATDDTIKLEGAIWTQSSLQKRSGVGVVRTPAPS